MATQGGPAKPVTVQAGGQQQGGAAIPVTVVTDGRAVEGGPALPIYLVTSGPVQGGPALPVVAAPYGARAVGGAAIPAYVVSGYLLSAYGAKVAAMGPIAYWPMDESSGAVAFDRSGNSRNGAYTGVALGATGIGDGRTSASFDGTTSYNNVFGASLAAAFNNQEGTAIVWIKASASGIWTDGVNRRFLRFAVDANNQVVFNKSSSNNNTDILYVAGSVTKGVTVSTFGGSTAWNCIGITWSKSADQVKAYGNGVQVSATTTGLGVWAGSIAATTTLIGAFVTTPTNVWSGSLAHCAIWNRALSAAEMLAAATV